MKPSCKYNLIWGLTALILFSFPITAPAKLKVVTTIPDLAAIAQEVGGDLVKVESIARGDQDPHYIEPKPSFALKLNQADLLIDVGLDLEVGWLPVLLTQSRNPKIQMGQKGRLNASEGLTILEIPAGPIDRSQGDVHPYGNPHYWLNPAHGVSLSRRVAESLEGLDPPNAGAYRKNQQVFVQKLEQKIDGWKRVLAPLRGREVVTHHKSFSYFMDWAGLKVLDVIEPKPGIPPSPSHILSLLEEMKGRNVLAVITENYYDPKPSREVSEKTGVKVLFLPTSVGGEKGIDRYEDLFEVLVKEIREGS